MINSKNDYLKYLKQDKLALGKNYKSPKLVHDEIWRFEILLRKTEYYVNCKKTPSGIKKTRKSIIGKLYSKVLQFLYYKKRLKYNTYIPLNVFGPGLSIAHFGSIIVNGNAKIGKNCRIQDSVTIGATNGASDAPVLGDNIFIGSGARIIGKVNIASDIAIGSNAVVVNNFNESGITIGGVPAKKISDNNSHSNLNKYLEIDK